MPVWSAIGCCHGIEYNGWGNVIYNHSFMANKHTHYFPVQLVETLVFTSIFIYMINRIMKNKFNWKTLGISFILCGVSKFLLDYLRISHVNIMISSNQVISIVFVIIGTAMIILNHKKIGKLCKT